MKTSRRRAAFIAILASFSHEVGMCADTEQSNNGASTLNGSANSAVVIKRPIDCLAPSTVTSGIKAPHLDVRKTPKLDDFYDAHDKVDGRVVQGLVTLSITVSKSGCVLDGMIRQSSGLAVLDQAALNWVWHAIFFPAGEKGAPEESTVTFNVRFNPLN